MVALSRVIDNSVSTRSWHFEFWKVIGTFLAITLKPGLWSLFQCYFSTMIHPLLYLVLGSTNFYLVFPWLNMYIPKSKFRPCKLAIRDTGKRCSSKRRETYRDCMDNNEFWHWFWYRLTYLDMNIRVDFRAIKHSKSVRHVDIYHPFGFSLILPDSHWI